MNGFWRAWALAAVLAAAPWGAQGQQDAAESRGPYVVLCPITGMIDDGIAVLVERVVAEHPDAQALIFEVDTPGGLVDAAIETSKHILDAEPRTIAYITGMGAISAGALISFSCDDLIMSPDSNIGAATPVIMSQEGPKPTSEKEVSFMRAKMRALAERNAHNRFIAEAMVDKDIELRAKPDKDGRWAVYAADATDAEKTEERERVDRVIDAVVKVVEALPKGLDEVRRRVGEAAAQPPTQDEPSAPDAPAPPAVEGEEVVLAQGKLLTLTPQEALRYGVIPATADDLDQVLEFYGLSGAEVVETAMTWSERVFRFLTSPVVSGLLLLLGIGGLYMEMKTPGFGVFGAVGLICLSLFFGAHLILGLADWVDVLLVVVGLSLIVVEVFVLPGFGVAGVSGFLCLFIGLYLSLTRVTFPQYSWDFVRLQNAGTSLLTAFLSSILCLYLFWRLFPKTSLFNRLMQEGVQTADSGYVVQTAEDETTHIGARGVALSTLRPVGRGRFGAKTLQVMSRSEYLEKGAPVVIVNVEGNRYVVDRAPGAAQESGE